MKKFAIAYLILILLNVVGLIFFIYSKVWMVVIETSVIIILLAIGTILFTSRRSKIGYYILFLVLLLGLISGVLVLSILKILLYGALLYDLVKNGKPLIEDQQVQHI